MKYIIKTEKNYEFGVGRAYLGDNMIYGMKDEVPTDELAFEYDTTDSPNLEYTLNSVKYTATTTPYSTRIDNPIVNIRQMFADTSITKLIKIPDLSKIDSYREVFTRCYKLTSINLENFTSPIRMMDNMFSFCGSLQSLDLSKFNTTELDSIFYAFSNCGSLTEINLSNWDLSKVTEMTGAFQGCSKLSTIYMNDCSCATIQKIKDALAQSNIPQGQVTILTNTVCP